MGDLFAYWGIPDGLGILILVILLAHIVLIGVLCIKTRGKADKWRREKKLKSGQEREHQD
jgi:UPF0716 family protein affecting phage T7 exclusion